MLKGAEPPPANLSSTPFLILSTSAYYYGLLSRSVSGNLVCNRIPSRRETRIISAKADLGLLSFCIVTPPIARLDTIPTTETERSCDPTANSEMSPLPAGVLDNETHFPP